MNDGLRNSDAPAARNTRSATPIGKEPPSSERNGQEPRSLVSIVRGTANTLTLIGAILIAIGWAMHWPPFILGRVALLTVTTFVVSFVAILIENARESSHAYDEDDDA